MHIWEYYPADAETEYRQCLDEGLAAEPYEQLFTAVQAMPCGEVQKEFGDALFDLTRSLETREGYRYNEPSDPEGIKSLCRKYPLDIKPIKEGDYDKVYGAWMGRICGCMHGKPVEGVRTNIFIPFLKETGNYPLKRYIYKSDFTDEMYEKYKDYPFKERVYADEIDCMPWDDDTNYVVLDQCIIEKYGKEFTAENVAKAWTELQKKDAYCTAERVAFCNFINGYKPPYSAIYKNPYREWIGAQIRGDYYGYIFPGDPEKAAEAAYKDASISHVKNGIYGEMFVAAALAIAACTDDMTTICLAVETGFDTDCNGATAGSVFGMAYGINAIPEYWKKPINDTLETTVFGVGTVKISDRVKLTLKHIAK